MLKKTLVLLSLSIAALVFTGCDGGTAQMGPKEANALGALGIPNALGILKIEKQNYQPTKATTVPVSTDELYTRKNFQGSKTTFLWGLVTLKDY